MYTRRVLDLREFIAGALGLSVDSSAFLRLPVRNNVINHKPRRYKLGMKNKARHNKRTRR